MTIAIAWVRKLRDCEELVFVSDSRLSGDTRNFDAGPKILTFSRTDCAIAFAGYTGHAFPMMLQIQRAIDSHAPARRRSMDLYTLRKHILQIANSMKDEIRHSPGLSKLEKLIPEACFLFGGYSWIRKQFALWRISYSEVRNRFEAQQPDWIGYSEEAKKYLFSTTWSQESQLAENRKIALIGDQAHSARERLVAILNEKTEHGLSPKPMDMEPFEVVRDMLRDEHHSETVGGAPQVVKVYQYMRTASLGVFWPNKKAGKVYLQGRRCLDYERIDNWLLDPDTLKSENPSFTKAEKDFPTPLCSESDDAAG